MSKAFTMLSKLRFGVGDSKDFEIKVEVNYNFVKARAGLRDDPPEGPEIDIKSIRFRHEDHNGRLYWIEVPDWMMEYLTTNDEFQDELIAYAEE